MSAPSGRDTIEPLLRYCELKGYRGPATDDYGWARTAQVVGNFFGSANSARIMPYSDDVSMDPGDNGIYVIEGWKIIERVGPYKGFEEASAGRWPASGRASSLRGLGAGVSREASALSLCPRHADDRWAAQGLLFPVDVSV